eukprot:6214313-Pleurochrysis_carterae.AAC.6
MPYARQHKRTRPCGLPHIPAAVGSQRRGRGYGGAQRWGCRAPICAVSPRGRLRAIAVGTSSQNKTCCVTRHVTQKKFLTQNGTL